MIEIAQVMTDKRLMNPPERKGAFKLPAHRKRRLRTVQRQPDRLGA